MSLWRCGNNQKLDGKKKSVISSRNQNAIFLPLFIVSKWLELNKCDFWHYFRKLKNQSSKIVLIFVKIHFSKKGYWLIASNACLHAYALDSTSQDFLCRLVKDIHIVLKCGALQPRFCEALWVHREKTYELCDRLL